jgi:anti-anti-sigma factor
MRSSDGVVVAVHGELDLTTRHRLLAEVGALRSAGHPRIVLDLRPTTFIDASGMGAVVQVTRASRMTGARSTIVPGPPSVMRAFALAGLSDRLPFARHPVGASPSEEAAATFARPRGADDSPPRPAPVDPQAVADRAGCLLMMLEPDGRIAYFNGRCEKVTGYASAQVVGRRPWEVFIPPDEAERYRETYARVRDTPLPDGYETWWQHRDGDRRLIRWTNRRLAGGADSPILVTGMEAGPHETAAEAAAQSR